MKGFLEKCREFDVWNRDKNYDSAFPTLLSLNLLVLTGSYKFFKIKTQSVQLKFLTETAVIRLMELLFVRLSKEKTTL